MYTSHPTTMYQVRQLMAEELKVEAQRERLAKQALTNGTHRRLRMAGITHGLGAALIWLGSKVQGTRTPEVAASGAAG